MICFKLQSKFNFDEFFKLIIRIQFKFVDEIFGYDNDNRPSSFWYQYISIDTYTKKE